MSMYIDMETPKRGMVVNIYTDGRVTNHFDEFGETIGKAVPVPPHGELIEKNAVFKLIQSMPSVDKLLPVEFMKALHEIPTVIPAEAWLD